MHEHHRKRLRRRYESTGLDNFEEHVILELLLFNSIPRTDTNPTAHRLIDKFGSLGGVFAASEKELCEVSGVGKVTARMLRSVPALMLSRMMHEYSEPLFPRDVQLYGAENIAKARLSVIAGWHMEHLPENTVSVFAFEQSGSPTAVFDYADDGDTVNSDGTDLAENATGLAKLICADLAESGSAEYILVVKNGKGEKTFPADGSISQILEPYVCRGRYLLSGYSLENF